jgi:hypothetical protein
MLASRAPGENIPWSALESTLRPRDLSIPRTAEILGLAGLLDEDRVLPLATFRNIAIAAVRLVGFPGTAAGRRWAHAIPPGHWRSSISYNENDHQP